MVFGCISIEYSKYIHNSAKNHLPSSITKKLVSMIINLPIAIAKGFFRGLP